MTRIREEEDCLVKVENRKMLMILTSSFTN